MIEKNGKIITPTKMIDPVIPYRVKKKKSSKQNKKGKK